MLTDTLASLAGMRVPAGLAWEIVVVDNNSTDHTADVVSSFDGRLPVRRVFEPQQGLSFARNRAIAEARGRLLVWTDDDVRVDPNWLTAYAEAVERWPDAGFFGGVIRPAFEVEPPSWVTANLDLLGGMVLVRDFGPTERPLESFEDPYGANLAFRDWALEDLRFNTALGRSGGGGLLGEEVEVVQTLRHRGVVGVWVAGAIVDHHVPAQRITQRYLHDYFVSVGRTDVALRQANPRIKSRLGRTLQRLAILKAYARYVTRRAMANDSWVSSYAHAARLRGQLLQRRGSPTPAGRSTGEPQ